jgi:AraC family transcriptional regulator
MAQNQLNVIVNGRRETAHVGVRMSSAHSCWSGFLWEAHDVTSGFAKTMLWPQPQVVLVTSGQVEVRERSFSRMASFLAGPGSVTVWPAGHESKSISWDGPCETVDVGIESSTLDRLGHHDDLMAAMALAPQPGVQDPQLQTLVSAMVTEVQAGCPAGRLYGESLSLAFAAHLLGRYSAIKRTRDAVKGGLSKRQLATVLEFIHDNMKSDLSLAELADTACLSSSHFALSFKTSVGISPHQYVIRERVNRARQLLAEGRLSITEVTHAVGFSNQSHFTETFRRVTGTTPRQFQQAQ